VAVGPAEETAPTLARNRPFLLVLTALGLSSLGDGVRTAALPLLVVSMTNNPIAVTGVVVANRIPWLLVGLVSGVIADRYDRRALMAAVDTMRMVAAGTLALFVLTGFEQLWLVYVVALALGVGETLFDTAAMAVLPEIVPKTHLGRANGRLFSTNLVAGSFVGPALGGVLFEFSHASPFAVDAVTFLLAASLVTASRRRSGPAAAAGASHRIDRDKSFLGEVGEGWAWIAARPLMRTFYSIIAVVNFTQGAAQAVLVILVVHELALPTAAFGILLTVSGVGAFLGGLLSSRLGDVIGVYRVLLPGVALSVPLFLVIGGTHDVVVLAVALALNSFIGVVVNIQMLSMRQRIIPNRIMGRVSSMGQLIVFGIAIPVGALAGGTVASAFGVRWVFFGSAGLIAVLIVLRSSQLFPDRLRTKVEEMAAEVTT